MGVSFKNEKSAIIYYHYLYNLFLCRKQNINQNILKNAGIDYPLILMVKTGISRFPPPPPGFYPSLGLDSTF